MGMATVLMVAEKPMLAVSIANLLSGGQMRKRKGRNNVCSICEYHGEFFGVKAFFKVTSTCGHVMSVDFPSQYNNWDKIEPVELFSAPICKKEANPKMRMREFLAHEAAGCNYLVLWLDCDKEGENICFEVIDAVKNSMTIRNVGSKSDNVYRARFSSITEKDIKLAMSKLGRPNVNESLSVDARQELDLRIGCAFTRFQTQYFQGKYGNLDSSCISFGPCQTPTLGLCVARHDAIIQFRPEQFWKIQASFNVDGINITADHSRGRMFDKNVCLIFYDKIKRMNTGSVIDITRKEGIKDRPQALNTVEMLRVASSGLGMSPSQAMSIAESLYTQGFISYPRTETTAYSNNFDFLEILRNEVNNPKWGSIVKELLQQRRLNPQTGADKGDHPPITPMLPNNGSLSGDALRLYEYILSHFLATLMPSCRFLTTTIKISVADEVFVISGKVLMDPGFTTVMPWLTPSDTHNIPDLRVSQELILSQLQIIDGQTSPPDYLTEAELISLMEKHGIGTDASIPVHISNICQRNYVSVGSKRRLIPTSLGIALIHGYTKIDQELALPTMRSEVEQQLNLIAHGSANYLEVKNHVLINFKAKFLYFIKEIARIDSLFEVSFTPLAESGKPFSRCGKCHRFMKLISSKVKRMYCPNCHDTYSLPSSANGVIKLYGEYTCPLDDFDLLHWNDGKGKFASSYAFCPYCWNNPPFEDMKKGQGCDNCSHPTCPHSFKNQGIAKCPNKCSYGNGVLVFDPYSSPKWRISCNKCSSSIDVFHGASKVKVSNDRCSSCEAMLISAEYKGSSSLPEEAHSYKGCIFCDSEISHLISMNFANGNIGSGREFYNRGGSVRGRSSRGRNRTRGRGRR